MPNPNELTYEFETQSQMILRRALENFPHDSVLKETVKGMKQVAESVLKVDHPDEERFKKLACQAIGRIKDIPASNAEQENIKLNLLTQVRQFQEQVEPVLEKIAGLDWRFVWLGWPGFELVG